MYHSLLDRLKSQHEAIRFIIEKLDEADLTKQWIPGKWSIKDNIVHLAKYQPVFQERIHLILSQEKPQFGRYKAENDPEFDAWRLYDLPRLLNRMDEDRKIIFKTFSALKTEQMNRIGTHRKYGELTLTQWTEFFLLHEAHHIFTIFQLTHDTELREF
jgi:hypothetical protein